MPAPNAELADMPCVDVVITFLSSIVIRSALIAAQLLRVVDAHGRLRPQPVDLKKIARPQFARFFNPTIQGDALFRRHFRMTHASFAKLCLEIPERPVSPNNEQRALSHSEQVLVWLAFLVHEGGEVAVARLLNVSASTVHDCVVSVTSRFIHPGLSKHMPMPSLDRQHSIAHAIDAKYHLPNCVGFIDGTLIRLGVEPQRGGRRFSSHKWFNAINVVAVCDHNGYFWSVDVSKPGGMHDAKAWSTSFLGEHWGAAELEWIPGAYLLGDSGYALRSNTLVPYRVDECDEKKLSATVFEQRLLFNASHRSARNAIERAFGRAKNRFRLLKSVSLDPRHDHLWDVITCCFILHNMLQGMGDDVDKVSKNKKKYDRAVARAVATNEKAKPRRRESAARRELDALAQGRALRERVVLHVDQVYSVAPSADHDARSALIQREKQQLEAKASKRKDKRGAASNAASHAVRQRQPDAIDAIIEPRAPKRRRIHGPVH
jgi:DDE superfamily endonuclease